MFSSFLSFDTSRKRNKTNIIKIVVVEIHHEKLLALFTLSPDVPECHLQQALEDMVAQRPPKDGYMRDEEKLSGLWAGPIGFAYLFIHVARRRPA